LRSITADAPPCQLGQWVGFVDPSAVPAAPGARQAEWFFISRGGLTPNGAANGAQ